MEFRVNENVVMENVRLIYRNFSGKPSKYNHEGDRNAAFIIKDPDEAQRLIDAGWPVRARAPRTPDDDPFYFMPFKVKFGARPPRVFMLVGHKKTALTEETIDALDYAEIINADICVRPYNWERDGKSGVSAYLKTLYVTVSGDEFANKYAPEYDNDSGIDANNPDDDKDLPWN